MDLVNTMTVRGHEHHFAVGQGDVTDELMEFAAWKGMRLIEHSAASQLSAIGRR